MTSNGEKDDKMATQKYKYTSIQLGLIEYQYGLSPCLRDMGMNVDDKFKI
jgi:hypothetical protein